MCVCVCVCVCVNVCVCVVIVIVVVVYRVLLVRSSKGVVLCCVAWIDRINSLIDRFTRCGCAVYRLPAIAMFWQLDVTNNDNDDRQWNGWRVIDTSSRCVAAASITLVLIR